MRMALLTVSDSRRSHHDWSGSTLVHKAQEAGHVLSEHLRVADSLYSIRAAVSLWIDDEAIDFIVSTGGTGPTGRDLTAAALRPLFDKELPGFGERFRQLSWEDVGQGAMLSDAVLGLANGKPIFALPGSPAACSLAWDALIAPQMSDILGMCSLGRLLPRLRER